MSMPWAFVVLVVLVIVRSILSLQGRMAHMPGIAWERARRDLYPVGRVPGALSFVAVCGRTRSLEAVAPERQSHHYPRGFGDVFQVEHEFLWAYPASW